MEEKEEEKKRNNNWICTLNIISQTVTVVQHQLSGCPLVYNGVMMKWMEGQKLQREWDTHTHTWKRIVSIEHKSKRHQQQHSARNKATKSKKCIEEHDINYAPNYIYSSTLLVHRPQCAMILLCSILQCDLRIRWWCAVYVIWFCYFVFLIINMNNPFRFLRSITKSNRSDVLLLSFSFVYIYIYMCTLHSVVYCLFVFSFIFFTLALFCISFSLPRSIYSSPFQPYYLLFASTYSFYLSVLLFISLK